MSVEGCFEVEESRRNDFIRNNIVGILPKEERGGVQQKVEKLVRDYEGLDLDAVSTLAYAAERGRFEEFFDKLEVYFEKNLGLVHPEARKNLSVPGVVKAREFFLRCYSDMEIQSRSNVAG